MEDHDLCAGLLRDPGGVIEHADGHVQLLPALGVAHEAGKRGVNGQGDVVLACKLAEARSAGLLVHPELALEVDLARAVAASTQELDRLFGVSCEGTRAGSEPHSRRTGR